MAIISLEQNLKCNINAYFAECLQDFNETKDFVSNFNSVAFLSDYYCFQGAIDICVFTCFLIKI